MIFAAVDIFHYRFGKGRYRDDRLHRRGWRTAVAENFSGDAEPALSDSLLMHPRHSVASWLIMYMSNNVASHVATYGGDGQIFHSTTAGALRQPLSHFLDGRSLIKVEDHPVVMTEHERARLSVAERELIGVPYNWRGTILQGLGLLIGREHPGYSIVFRRDSAPVNWRLYADTLLTFALPALLLVPPHAVAATALGYLLVVGVNVTRAIRSARRAQLQIPSVGLRIAAQYSALLELLMERGSPGQAQRTEASEITEALPVLLISLAHGHWQLSVRKRQPGDDPQAHRLAACLLLAAGGQDRQARDSVEALALGVLRDHDAWEPPALDELVRIVDEMDGTRLAAALELLVPSRTDHLPLLADICAQIAYHLGDTPDLAEPYARRAHEAGCPGSAALLGIILARLGSTDESESLLRAAVEDGDQDGLHNLAVLLWQRGDLAEMEALLRDAADQGQVGAAHQLAVHLMDTGREAEAEVVYRTAAEAGHSPSAYNLAIVLEGRDELAEAEGWYRLAADAGHAQAANNLGWMAVRRDDMTSAESWFRTGAAAGGLEALANLGVLLAKRGDYVEGYTCLKAAAEAGQDDAVAMLRVMSVSDEPEE